MTAVAETHFWFDPTGIELRHEDGRLALTRMLPQRRFDVIVGDAFHDLTAPPHLVTREFARLLRGRLAPGGFYAQNLIDSSEDPRFLYAFVATFRQVFDHVEAWVDLDQPGAGARRSFLVVAGDAASSRLPPCLLPCLPPCLQPCAIAISETAERQTVVCRSGRRWLMPALPVPVRAWIERNLL